MIVAEFVPEAGDLVWLQFDPQAGHEQAGHRPAVVLSPLADNRKTGQMLCCPVTTRIKLYPFKVPIAGRRVSVVLADQVKNLDWSARQAEPKGRVTDAELGQVRAKLRALVG